MSDPINAVGAFLAVLGVVGVISASNSRQSEHKAFGWVSAIMLALGVALIVY